MDKVLEVATSFLNWQNPYWNSFCHPEHLAGWLLTNLHCAYCKVDLLEVHISAHRAHTDHLLPKSKYPELRDQSMMNAVASCDACNCLKGDWDPNELDPIYSAGDQLTYEMRQALIQRTIEQFAFDGNVRRNRGLDIVKIRLAAQQAREKLS